MVGLRRRHARRGGRSCCIGCRCHLFSLVRICPPATRLSELVVRFFPRQKFFFCVGLVAVKYRVETGRRCCCGWLRKGGCSRQQNGQGRKKAPCCPGRAWVCTGLDKHKHLPNYKWARWLTPRYSRQCQPASGLCRVQVQTQLGPGVQEIGGFWLSAATALV